MNYSLLWSELSTDPTGKGYVTPTDPANDQTNMDLLNEETLTREVSSITAQELFEATDLSEVAALTVAQQRVYHSLIGMDTLSVEQGSNARSQLASLFPAGSNTRANLIALVQALVNYSRREELGFPRIYVHHIETARDRFGS